MPKQLEEKLKREAAQRGYSKERSDAYTYGTMRKTGWTPSTQKKRQGMLPRAPY
jgi:hypothetical protein